MFLFEGVEVMEYEVVQVKVPKGMVKEGMQLVIGVPRQTHLLIGSFHCPGVGACSVFLIPTPLKPDWNPPKLKKGWVTWDTTGGWYFWIGPDKPKHTFDIGWVDAKTGCGDGGLYIGEEMAELLGCPDCTGFDERECIWEVGE